MNNTANLTQNLRDGRWTECASTATSLDNILTNDQTQKSPYELFYGSPSKIVNNLRTFGEIGIVKTAQKTQSKIINRGKACIFVGYPSNHLSATFRMLNCRTHKVIISCNVIWMNKMHATPSETPTIDTNNDELIDEPDPVPDNPTSQPALTNPPPNPPPNPAPRLLCEVCN